MADDVKLTPLQKEAVESARLAVGKLNFLASQGVVNPLAIIESRITYLVDWLIPPDEEGTEKLMHNGMHVPTNPKRLKFDIYCNNKMIEQLDTAMTQQGGLHVVKGIDNNGTS